VRWSKENAETALACGILIIVFLLIFAAELIARLFLGRP
jgi:hypothetical protein